MLLELDGVNAYYGKSHVLQSVSLSIDAGEVVALLGRNGSGRSTTCKTIMGLVPAKSGTIRFKGQDVTNASPFKLAQLGIAFVPEDRRIFPNLTVGENLRLAALAGRKGAWTEKRAYDYFPVRGERKDKPAKLSGGEQQMLAISRALLTNPKLLVMDEPT
ncbi:MAG: ABC transporter ATP-binding protein, partial [Candidatus Eremiobacteraeota bacterium]|nr:ABC transporter ATP-binding protein [Candidatus Eremiobacteraeota bacterium]